MVDIKSSYIGEHLNVKTKAIPRKDLNMTEKQLTIQEKMAYLAGIIDGEGHIGMYVSKYKDGSPRYRTRLGVSNNHLGLINWLIQEFGGFKKEQKRYDENHAIGYFWQLNDNDSDYILEAVLPYLIVKKQQAILFLYYRKLQKLSNDTCPGRSFVNHELRKQIHAGMKFLNRRGKESVETNTLDINELLMKIESELDRNIKRRVSDGLSVSNS